jgi:hypothetical protein
MLITPSSQSKWKTRNQEILREAVHGDMLPVEETTVMDVDQRLPVGIWIGSREDKKVLLF